MSATLKNLVAGRPDLRIKRGRVRKARPVRASKADELWYKANLRALVGRLRESTNERLLPVLARYKDRYAPAIATDAIYEDEINATLNGLASAFGGLDDFAARLAAEAVRKNLTSVDERLSKSLKSAVGIDVKNVMRPSEALQIKMAAANKVNVELIKSIPQQYFDRISAAVKSNIEAGVRYESLIAQIQEIGGVTESRANLIARDQTSKMNSAFNEARQTDMGIESYEWIGSDDERERDSHRENNGKIFRWDSPPPETGHPGEDINCRCSASAIFEF